MAIKRTNGNGLDGPAAARPLQSEQSIIWILWLTYGVFYFCRTNLSAAIAADPGLKTPVSEGGLGLSSLQVGLILGALKLTYGLGQMVNGQFSEQFSPRRLLAIGMLGSAALNVLFGLSTGFYFLLFVWACNGYCQSLGWTPCMRVAGVRIPVGRRGKAIGIIGTGYQITAALTFLVAGWAADRFGWQGALFVPAGILAAGAVFMWIFLEDPPQAVAAKDAAVGLPIANTFAGNLLITLGNPRLWLLGAALGLLNACRYGFLDWGLTHLTGIQTSGPLAEASASLAGLAGSPFGQGQLLVTSAVHSGISAEASVGKEAIKYAVLPLGGVAGAFLAGWATDRFFNSRRAPIIFILLVCLGSFTLLYDVAARTSTIATVILLVLIGFCIYGPQVLLVGTAPADLARRGTAAAAAGFVNSLGYMGAFSGDVVTGFFLDRQGWQFTIYVWAGWAFASAVISAFLWNATGKSTD